MAVKKVSVPQLGTLHLYKRRGARGLRLSVGHNGDIRVSLPPWVPYRAAVEFAAKQRDWIASQQSVSVPITHGNRIGKAHHISFIPELGRRTVATRISSIGEIRIFTPSELPIEHPDVQKAVERASIRALKQQAEKLLPQRLQALARQHGFEYDTVTVKQLKSRWGSCSDRRDIALNCFLMQLPWHLIDYVLLHELTHTRVMAHGPRFWDELGRYVPNLKTIRKEIKAYRPILLAQ
jgi:hypothetical protein